MTALTLNLQSIIQLTDEQFSQLCQDNETLRFERTATGELIIMPPVGGETSNRNAGLTAQLWIWNEQNKLGKVFDSSGATKVAPPRSALVKSSHAILARLRLAFLILEPLALALSKVMLIRLAPLKSASRKFTPVKSAPAIVAPLRFALFKSTQDRSLLLPTKVHLQLAHN